MTLDEIIEGLSTAEVAPDAMLHAGVVYAERLAPRVFAIAEKHRGRRTGRCAIRGRLSLSGTGSLLIQEQTRPSRWCSFAKFVITAHRRTG